MTDIKNIKTVTFCKAGSRTKTLVNRRFGALLVYAYVGGHGKRKRPAWLCRCDCGIFTCITGDNLVGGNSTNCGCLREIAFRASRKTHGLSNKIPEYGIWKEMKARCNRKSHIQFADYGGRGITVCDRWQESFENFMADMGTRLTNRHTIERRDNALGYSPENCYWATRVRQNNNRRSNHRITLNGRTQNLMQWLTELGVNKSTFYTRVKSGYTEQDALRSLAK